MASERKTKVGALFSITKEDSHCSNRADRLPKKIELEGTFFFLIE